MYAGVDGCKGGWVVVRSATGDFNDSADILLLKTFPEVLEAVATCRTTGLDMPVGLPQGAEPRACDLLAREELRHRAPERLKNPGSRIFLAPPRETLKASTPDEFQGLHRAIRGVGAGFPVWGIVPRLREVDQAMTPTLQARIFESYPELTFAHLAGHLLPSKKAPEGLAARIVLACGDNCSQPRKTIHSGQVSAHPDDVLDAAACMIAARAHDPDTPAVDAQQRRLPSTAPPADERGLRMEIRF